MQNHNATLYKRVNDMAYSSDFKRSLTKEEFTQLLLNQDLLEVDYRHKIEPPSFDEICEMFEFLDEDKSGMISSDDLLKFLALCERLKAAGFD